MKAINKIILCTLILSMPLAGCDTDELHDLNIDPQAVGEIDVNFLFTAAELGSAAGGSSGDNRYIDWRTNIGFAAHAIQQLANVSGGIAPGDKYFDNAESYNAPWEFIYGDQLKNLQEIIRQTGPGGTDEGRKVNLRHASRILKVFNFHRLTDYYGNVPYSQSLKAIDKVYFPIYDTQQSIYTDMLNELSEATAALTPLVATDPDDNAFANADLIYDGDIERWKRFGYSLMLRLAMRISNVAPDMAATYVTEAVDGGVFQSNDDNAWIGMAIGPSEWTNQNGISRAFASGDGGQPSILSKTLVDMLKGADPNNAADDDPRLRILSNGVDGNKDPLVQRGMPNGLDQGTLDNYVGEENVDANATFSVINLLLLDDDDPYMLMNHAEVEFLMAEAIERGIGTVGGSAQSHYDAGVKSAMQMYTPFGQGVPENVAALTVTDTEVSDYLAAHPYTGTTEEKLEMIGNQLWLSKFFNWWEAWSDWRRTGYPVLTPVNYSGNVTGGTIPRKLRIPPLEAAGNPNYSGGEGAKATLPDDPTTRVWWDGGE